jgi:glycogen(starch) synthase
MKILFIIPEEYNGARWGGVTTYTISLSAELKKRGHSVSILTPGANNRSFSDKGIMIYTMTREKHIPLLGRICPVVSERIEWAQNVYTFVRSHDRFDIIEAPEWGSSTLFLCLQKTSKIIVRLHRSWYQYKKDNKLPLSISDYITDLFERYCIVSASGVSSPTKFMLDQYKIIRQILRVKGVPVRIIPSGVIAPLVKLSSRNRLRDPYLLTVGRVEIGKGSVLLVEAFICICQKYPKLNLVFVGEDTCMYIHNKWTSCIQYLREQLLKTHMQDRVFFISRRTRQELAKYYQGCLLYVAPSIGHENPSLAVLEALSYGKPVVGSTAGGIPEVVHHKKNGLIFREDDVQSLTNALDTMVKDSKLRCAIESRNLSHRFLYGLQTNVPRVLRFYRDLM